MNIYVQTNKYLRNSINLETILNLLRTNWTINLRIWQYPNRRGCIWRNWCSSQACPRRPCLRWYVASLTGSGSGSYHSSITTTLLITGGTQSMCSRETADALLLSSPQLLVYHRTAFMNENFVSDSIVSLLWNQLCLSRFERFILQ